MAGFRVRYDPDLVVRHHDVASAGQEWTKNVREGRAWGAAAHDLGLLPKVLAWGALLAAAAAVAAWRPALGLPVLAAALWLPALPRAWRRRRDMPSRALVVGVAASPPFDLAFLANYVVGLGSHLLRAIRFRRHKQVPA